MRPVRGSISAGSLSVYVDLSFASAAVLEHEPRQLVVLGELLEHVLGGRRLALRRLAEHRSA